MRQAASSQSRSMRPSAASGAISRPRGSGGRRGRRDARPRRRSAARAALPLSDAKERIERRVGAPPSPPETKVDATRGAAPQRPATSRRAFSTISARRAPLGVDRGRVAGGVHRRKRRLTRFRAKRRGRVIVEIGPCSLRRPMQYSGGSVRNGRRVSANASRRAVFPCNCGRLACYEAASEASPRRLQSRHTRADPAPQAASARSVWAGQPARRGPSSFGVFHARSLFQRSRRPAGRPLSSRQAARRADRGRAASAPAVRRHDEQPDRLQHLLQFRRARVFGAAVQLPRRRPLAGRVRPRSGRIVGRGLRARLGAVDQPRGARLLDRRRFLRLVDRHAASDAAARDRGLHLDRAARQSLRLQLPRPLPVVGPVRPWRQGPGCAAQGSPGPHREAEDAEGHRDRACGDPRGQPLLRGLHRRSAGRRRRLSRQASRHAASRARAACARNGPSTPPRAAKANNKRRRPCR